MREEGSNEKDGVDKIQWGRTRRMKCVNLVKSWRSGDETSRIKRQGEMHKQREEIGMGKRASKRLIVPASEFTAEGILCRFVVSGVGRRRSCDAMRLYAMFSGSLLTRAYLAYARSMYPWTEGAEIQKISHQG